MKSDKLSNPPREIGELISNVKSSVTMNINDGIPEMGRREFFKYMDLGVTDATNGKLGVKYVVSEGGAYNTEGDNTTGWHFHDCDWQWTFLISGEIELLFEDGTRQVKTAGASAFTPGYVKHNEVRMSDRIEAIEITSPAAMGTFSCEVPDAWK
jgi:hypothetical protein